jgi:hypothetical protein
MFMKFNPYAVLLMTGALMLITVVVAQTGPNATLLKAGVRSVDRDVSTFAARTLTSLQVRTTPTDEEGKPRARIASIDTEPKGNVSDN